MLFVINKTLIIQSCVQGVEDVVYAPNCLQNKRIYKGTSNKLF